MTPAELRDRLVARLCALGLVSVRDAPFVADAALRVVREAMREATPAMCAAWECSAILGPHASFEELAKRDWATMLAASPLREDKQ